MNRVTADSNIYISAFLRGGKPLELLEMARAGQCELAVTEDILNEIGRVLGTRLTVRSECLDWLLVLNVRHAERVLAVFTDHYNRHRAHRSLKLMPPDGRSVAEPNCRPQPVSVIRRDRLGGVIHEYDHAA